MITAALTVMMLLSAPFDVPSMDDFSFSVAAKEALDSGEGIWGVIQAAAATSYDKYMNWQGTFTSIFFMAMMPGIFGLRAYAVTPCIMLAVLFFGILYFFRALGDNEEDRIRLDIVSMLVFIAVTQCMPDPTEGIYWYNGAVHYTIPTAAAMFFCGAFVRNAEGNKKWYHNVLMYISAVLAGGGNYVTALVLALIILSYLVFSRVPFFGQRAFGFFSIMSYLILSASFAPLWYGSGNIEAGRARDAIYIFYMILLFLNLIMLVRRRESSSRLAAILTPDPYSVRWNLAGVLLFFACFIVNVLAPGNTVRASQTESYGIIHSVGLSLYSGFTVPLREWTDWLPALMLVVAAILFSSVGVRRVLPALPVFMLFMIMSFKAGPEHYTALSSVKSVANGDVFQYRAQVVDRTAFISTCTGDEVVKFYSIKPGPIFKGDISSDETQWENIAYARYYGLESIRGEGEYGVMER